MRNIYYHEISLKQVRNLLMYIINDDENDEEKKKPFEFSTMKVVINKIPTISESHCIGKFQN